MDDDQLTATRLRLALDREVAEHQLSPGAWPRLERRLRRQPWRRVAIATVCAAIVGAAVAVAPYLWHNLSGPAASHPHPQSRPPLVVVARTQLNGGVNDLTTGYGAVWAIGQGVIYRVDPATGRAVATISARGVNGKLSQIATGFGAVWATSDGARVGVYRIDPRANRVTSFIRLQPNPTGITAAYGRVWVTEPKAGTGVVIRIDPRANRVSGPPIQVGVGPGRIVPGAGALWVTNSGYVSRINPATGAVADVVSAVNGVDAAGAGSLWTTGVNVVQRVDPKTGHLTAAIPVPNAWRVIFWHGLAWALTTAPSGAGTIVGIDPASNRVIGHAVPFRGSPMAIAGGPTGLWVVGVANLNVTNQELVHLVLNPGPSS